MTESADLRMQLALRLSQLMRAEAARIGTKLDTRLRANGAAGHEFGTGPPQEYKEALLEYLKTL
jgi:hypothetical protein